MSKKNQSNRLTNQHKESKGVVGIFGDEATYQGVLAQFTDGTDTIFTSSTTPWEVFATGIDFDPVCSGGINSPSLNNINAQIALANSGNGGANSSVTWVNLS